MSSNTILSDGYHVLFPQSLIKSIQNRTSKVKEHALLKPFIFDGAQGLYHMYKNNKLYE